MRHVINDGPRGSYGARNAGVRASRGDILAFTDADCEPDPGWLTAIVRTLDDDPGVLIAGAIRMPLGPHPTLAALVDVTCHLDQERYVTNDGYAVTANVACTRATLEQAGPFDEQLQSSGDREWTTRAQRTGARLVFVPEASVAHPPRTSGKALWRKSKRVGEGGSALRRSTPKERRGRPNYLRRGWVRPRQRARGLVRVRANGAAPSRLRWWLAGAAQLAYVQYPQVIFSAKADALAALRRLRRDADTR